MAEVGGKKRKRLANGVEKPKKKVALENSTSSQIAVHLHSANGLEPVLMFTPGLSAPSTAFKAYRKSERPVVSDGPLAVSSKHDVLLHSSEHPRLDFTASSASHDPYLSHYVAIYDPSTKQLQLSPAHHLNLRATLRSGSPDAEEKRSKTIRQQRADLGREFGTKKAKKAISDKTVNAITKFNPAKGKDEAQDAVLELMADSALPTLNEKEQVEAALQSKPIPVPNHEAGKVEEVYTFDTLIPASDARLLSIKDWQENVRAAVPINFTHRYPAFRVGPLGKGDDILRLKALRYLSLLLQFHEALQKAGKAGKKVPKKEVLQRKLSSWPEALVNSVRLRFSNAQNELPKWHMDNLYTHMCALSLFVDGWTTDTTHLRTDLKMESKEIVQYFRELGCKVTPPTEGERTSLNQWWGEDRKDYKPMTKEVAAATKVARLRLPLDFPKARSGRKK